MIYAFGILGAVFGVLSAVTLVELECLRKVPETKDEKFGFNKFQRAKTKTCWDKHYFALGVKGQAQLKAHTTLDLYRFIPAYSLFLASLFVFLLGWRSIP